MQKKTIIAVVLVLVLAVLVGGSVLRLKGKKPQVAKEQSSGANLNQGNDKDKNGLVPSDVVLRFVGSTLAIPSNSIQAYKADPKDFLSENLKNEYDRTDGFIQQKLAIGDFPNSVSLNDVNAEKDHAAVEVYGNYKSSGTVKWIFELKREDSIWKIFKIASESHSDWQEYEVNSSDEKFRLEYPKDVYLRDCPSFNLGFSKKIEDINDCKESNSLLTPIWFHIATYSKPDVYIKRELDFYRNNFDQEIESQTEINGISAIKVSGTWKVVENSLRKDDFGKKNVIVIFSKDNKIYQFELLYKNLDNKNIEEYESLFDSLVSTFRFL